METSNYRICYNSLTDYNQGRLVFKWFNLDGTTLEEHQEELSNWLEELTNSSRDGQLREEWEIADYENIPRNIIDNYGLEAFFQWQEYVDLIGTEATNAALELDILSYDYRKHKEFNLTPEELQNIYVSSFDSWNVAEELALFYADNSTLLDEIPSHLQKYFDFKEYGEDLLIDTYDQHEGHVFLRI